MTEIFIKSDNCMCRPTDKGKTLSIAEGQTTIWRCPHTEGLTKSRKVEWK